MDKAALARLTSTDNLCIKVGRDRTLSWPSNYRMTGLRNPVVPREAVTKLSFRRSRRRSIEVIVSADVEGDNCTFIQLPEPFGQHTASRRYANRLVAFVIDNQPLLLCLPSL